MKVPRRKKTVVLTSRENFVWLSMQEIIPFIERSWLASAQAKTHEVICLNVDEHPLPELMTALLGADNIVFTCFTVRLCKIGALLRERLGSEARYFIYLHNQATITCWPFHEWGLGSALRADDVFVSSSSADAATMAHSFSNCRTEIVPFTVPGLLREYPLAPANSREIPYVYVGRLSAQKNLHTLLYAFRLLQDAHPELPWSLRIYGTDDNLGSPNMGLPSRRYGDSLKRLARTLGLEKRVGFAGYRKRAELHRTLARQRHIAVSASLHSDENFGMAQFRALCRGNLAVLTRWGGYADFGRSFGARVLFAPVTATDHGPWVDPTLFAKQLFLAARKYRSSDRLAKVRVPAIYREERIAARLRALALETSIPGVPLEMTELAKRIRRKRGRFAKENPDTGRIFESYADPDAAILFRSYRMTEAAQTSAPKQLRCYPWVRLTSRAATIRDPHRGDGEIRLAKSRARDAVLITDWRGASRVVSRQTAARLFSRGYAGPELGRQV